MCPESPLTPSRLAGSPLPWVGQAPPARQQDSLPELTFTLSREMPQLWPTPMSHLPSLQALASSPPLPAPHPKPEPTAAGNTCLGPQQASPPRHRLRAPRPAAWSRSSPRPTATGESRRDSAGVTTGRILGWRCSLGLCVWALCVITGVFTREAGDKGCVMWGAERL